MTRPDFERRTARVLAVIRWPGALGILLAVLIVGLCLWHGGLVAVAKGHLLN